MLLTRQNLFTGIAILLLTAASTLASAALIPSTARARWRPGPVKIAISQSLFQPEPNVKFDSDVRSAIARAIESWRTAADIDLVQIDSDRLSVSPAGNAGDGISLITIAPTAENVLLFKDDTDSAAKTRVFVDKRGYISEADIVLSPFLQFSTDGSYGTYDLEATLRHEIGHMLGLRHSSVVGSVMYDVTSRNGVFGESAKAGGALTDDDLSALRDLYDDGEYVNCCGVLNGKLSVAGKAVRTIDLWLEDGSSGRIVSHAIAAPDGSFRFGGVESGRYLIIARESSKAGNSSAVSVGEADITSGQTTSFTQKLAVEPINFSTELLGKNGILSDSPLRLHRGASYSLYIGGRQLRSDQVRLETSSPFITFEGPLVDTAYDDGISGINFSLNIDGRTPVGNYNICAVTAAGTRACMAGGLVIQSD